MNIFIKILPLVVLFTFSHAVLAKASSQDDINVDVKCFVELVGGGETISFWDVPKRDVSALSKSIVGAKIMKPKSKQKVEIYKVHECVLLQDNFTSARAKKLDAITAR